MTNPDGLKIRIVKGAKVFHVHPEDSVAEGVHLAKDQVHGLYDAPVKTTWKTGAFQDGSRQKHRKWLHRDLQLGFHVIETMANTWSFNDSEFRKMFDYQEDFWTLTPTPTTIEVETDLSGIRKLDVLMYEQPDFAPGISPQKMQYGNVIMKLRAGQPFWYESAATTSGFHEATGSSVVVQNPGDVVMYHKWVLPVGTFTIPDYQWVGAPGARTPGGPQGSRTVPVTVTSGNGGAVVDLDPQELMFRDPQDTNILAQMSGRFFNYAIPPYTPATTLGVSGGTVRLIQPRRWTRPWGLEAL